MIKDYLNFGGDYIYLGPFISATDGKTPVTDLVFVASDIKVLKNGAISLVDLIVPEGPFSQHVGNGIYVVVVLSGNFDVLGKIEFSVLKSGALPVKRVYEVRKTHAVSVNNVQNGTAILSPTTPIFDGENTLLTITPTSEAFFVSALTLDGRDVFSQLLPESGGSGVRYFPLQNVAAQHAFVVTISSNA
jgi:hypothetical protein